MAAHQDDRFAAPMVELRMSPHEVTADRTTYLVVLPDLTDELAERLVDVNPLLR